MQDIKKIYDIFAEEAYKNALQCRYECQEKITESTPVYIQKWDSQHPLFSFTKTDEEGKKTEIAITLHFDEPLELSPAEPPHFRHLFWVAPSENNGNGLVLKYVECGSVTPLPHLDIAYDDNAIVTLKISNEEKFKKIITGKYVFDAGKYQFIFVKTFQNGSLDWKMYGLSSEKSNDKKKSESRDIPTELTIIQSENNNGEKIRLIKNQRNKNVVFPSRFDSIEVLAYEEIDVTDISHAKEAREAILERVKGGDALTRLWTDYSNMELAVAADEKEKLGNVEYEIYGKPKDQIVRVKVFVDTKAEQNIMLKQLSANSTMFQLVCDSEYPPIVTLIKYNSKNNIATFRDELYRLPKRGMLQLSLLGDQIVNKRREYAVKAFFTGKHPVTKNLLFAVEGDVDSMIVKDHKHIPAMSRKTLAFIKEKFKIERLTENQEKAVEIALNNTNDITIIQGPPGTGKTTVISAICHRLLELADKKSKDHKSKAILASAFQNDTIEHLAAKIYTHGLPTVKIGKKTLGIRAEEYYKTELEEHLQNEIDSRGGEILTSLSKELQDLADKYSKETNIDDTIESLKEILDRYEIPSDMPIDRLNDVKSSIRTLKKRVRRCLELVDSIPETIESYNEEDGLSILMDIVESGLELSPDMISLIDKAPEDGADEEFINELKEQKNLLQKCVRFEFTQSEKRLHQEVSQWIADAALCAHHQEEKNYENEDDFIRTILSGIKQELHDNTSYIRNALQTYGETIAATNQLAGSKAMIDYPYIDNVILEEAARSNPLDLLIPMVKANNRIILVGDQNQLPHLLETKIAERSLASESNIDEKKKKRLLYEKSLFGIIFENVQKGARVRSITLQEQFRMHPTIGDFISRVYYKGTLKPGTADLAELKLHGLSLPWAKNKTFVFCNVDGSTPEGKTKRSKGRKVEAVKVMDLLDELKTDKAFKNLSVGIISFYSLQVDLLFEEAEKRGYAIKDDDGYAIHPDYRVLEGDKEKLRIGSVDSFQGKEFDVVILSTVRSNSITREEGNEKSVFGFLTLENRLNVAFSRAKKLVIVVGDANMYNDDFAKDHVSGLYEVCHNIINEDYGCSI